MGSFLDRLLGRSSAHSAQVAKERLQLVLVHDRSDLSEEKLAELRDAMIDLISRYVEIDQRRVEVFVEREKRASLLVANIPLVAHAQRR
ncbi:MAG: cell division topological specificity factor MinE [Anaerolineae bacterium]